MKDKKKVIVSLIVLVVIVSIIAIVASLSFAAPLDDDVKVDEDSELTYYIDVIYDGKDGSAVTSSDSATTQVYSDYIYVEDKIPEGLTFKGFVETDDGTIGAVKRSDGSFCAGYVDGGIDGLVFDNDTRTVSFKVKNLQAGCKITVGIITQTPTLSNGVNRMDFYNTAYGREGSMSIKSNTVHAFIGRDNISPYNVIYQYTGNVPASAPEVPVTTSYVAGSTVSVNQDIELEGYEFSGWETDDATVANGVFTMPSSHVTFEGHFTKKEELKKEVTYTISGSSPEGYLSPLDKSYPVGSDVKLDSLKPGDVINGYRFLGWTTDDVELPSTSVDQSTIFTMPNHSVTFVGKFERISYKVTYQFQGSVLPPNADSLLPAEKSYYPGDTVKVASFPVASGYKFLGWYSGDEFEMPEEDVVIYGEWMIETGVFSPKITKEIVNPKSSYQQGDVIQFKIAFINDTGLNLTDIMIEEQLEGCTFTSASLATISGRWLDSGDISIPTFGVSQIEFLSPSHAFITSLPDGTQGIIYAEYTVGSDTFKQMHNTVEVTGALATDSNYHLDSSKEYKAELEFIISNISLNINKTNEDGENITGAEFSLYRDSNLSNLVSTGLKFTGFSPNTTYYLVETKAPTGYQLLGKTLEVKVDSEGNITIPGYEVTSQDGVYQVSIANQEINVLPNTGGVGIIPYIIVGFIFIVGGVICLVRLLKKRGEKYEKNDQ